MSSPISPINDRFGPNQKIPGLFHIAVINLYSQQVTVFLDNSTNKGQEDSLKLGVTMFACRKLVYQGKGHPLSGFLFYFFEAEK